VANGRDQLAEVEACGKGTIYNKKQHWFKCAEKELKSNGIEAGRDEACRKVARNISQLSGGVVPLEP
jgi:hypothetical protein